MDMSIIIISWNAQEMLLKCLGSVYGTVVGDNFEVWVVDNGSTDGSPEAVKKNFPDVKLIENDVNLGFAGAVNLALKRAAGRHIVLLNSDTVLTSGSLETLTRFMDENPDVGVCGPQLLNVDGTKQNSIANIPTLATELLNKSLLRRLFPESYPGKEHNIEEPVEVESVIGACMAVRKETIDGVGPLDERFFFFLEETDWCKRMREGGWRVFFHPGAEVYHAGGGSAERVNTRARVEYWRSRYEFFEKHGSAPERMALRGGLLVKLFLGTFLSLLHNVVTLFTSVTARRRLKLYSTLIGWHLAGCPAAWGLGTASQEDR
ncbi:MAG: glycosyltransferase family 2 protein [Thermodesulfobacteriota bacterium]